MQAKHIAVVSRPSVGTQFHGLQFEESRELGIRHGTVL